MGSSNLSPILLVDDAGHQKGDFSVASLCIHLSECFSDPSNSLEIELQVFLSSTWKSLEVINYSADAHSREFLTRAKKLKQRNKKASWLLLFFKKKESHPRVFEHL